MPSSDVTALAPSPAPASADRLLRVLAAAVILVAALTGNTLARHLAEFDHAPSAAATTASWVTPPDGMPATAGLVGRPDHTPGPRQGGQHLLHLLGACLAVLASVLLLAATGQRSHGPMLVALVRVARSPAVALVLLQRWKPPPLAPPTLSPVIRT